MSNQNVASDVSSDDKLWSLLSYLINPIVPIIVLLMEDKKNRPFIKYHAVQALAWAALWFVASIVLVGLCLSPLALVGSIYFMIKAYQGEWVVIPVLTDFLKKQNWL